uniref:Uncharacterized protein n=1 Tax=Vitis vinifera TaxID=29760 RepID=A5C196_VITVI|nr:hypothetical protein VITISV_030641 [Vitis vinifera]
MSTPSRSRSSAKRDEGYFEWRKTMERRQLESKRQMQALLQETRRLREENEVLRIQGSSLTCVMNDLENDPCPRIMLHKMKAQTLLIFHQRDNVTKDLNCQTQCERGWNHRNLVRKGHLRPQPRKRIPTPQSHPPSRTIPYTKRYDELEGIHQMTLPPPPSSISRRLNDMLSTPFSSRIIHYDPPKGFLVPKFSTYDGSTDPFDHIMHNQQLMTLDIGNDMLLCKENESLREFVKWFGQAVLQVEAYNMDVVLQIFK